MAVYTYSDTEENRFWLQVMAEVALMIRNRLVPDGTKIIQKANEMAAKFEALYERAYKRPSGDELDRLNKEAYTAVQENRSFILFVLSEQVTKGLFVYFKPIFLNNLVSLCDKYLYILGSYTEKREPTFIPILQDIFWLPIFYTETRLISDGLGEFQIKLREQADDLTLSFTMLFQTALGLQGMSRIGEIEFPISIQYRRDIREKLNEFAEYVVELIGLVRQNMLPGTLSLLDLDFIYRKLCYYTVQLSDTAQLPKPACDPGGPRLMD